MVSLPSTAISLVSYPTNEITRSTFKEGTSRRNSPFKSVDVPVLPSPLTTILTPGKYSPVTSSATVPVTVWACSGCKANMHIARRDRTEHKLYFFIILFYWLVFCFSNEYRVILSGHDFTFTRNSSDVTK